MRVGRHNISIRHKILATYIVPMAISVLAVSGYLFSQTEDEITRQLNELGNVVSEHFSRSISFPLYTGNLAELNTIGQSIADQQNVYAVYVYDNSGKTLISQPGNIEKQRLTAYTRFSAYVYSPGILYNNVVFNNTQPYVSDNNNQIGSVEIYLTDEFIREDALFLAEKTILIISLFIFLSLIIVSFLSRKFIHPILNLCDTLKKVQQGNFSIRIEKNSNDEIGMLEKGFNDMISTLEDHHNTMEQKIYNATKELVSLIDMLEEKNIELEKSRVEAQKADQFKSEFLANISHEIRTPLNGVIGYSELLEKTARDKQQKDYISIINHSASLLYNIINDVLSFEKIESGKIRIENHFCNLHSCLESTVGMLSNFAHKKSLELVLNIHSDVPEYIFIDDIRLTQIINNLVNNAIKFTESGSILVEASCLDRSSDNKKCDIEIVITDTGIGISQEQIPSLFDSFTQADSSITRKYGGTGLGLTISRKLIELMGGTIRVQSEKDVGSIFTIRLPVRIDDHHLPESRIKCRDKTIIIYDSHPSSYRALRNCLLHFGSIVMHHSDIVKIVETLQSDLDTVAIIALTQDDLRKNLLPGIYQQLHEFNNRVLYLLSTNSLEAFFETDPHDINWVSKPFYRHTLYEQINCNSNALDSVEQDEVMQADTQNHRQEKTFTSLVAEDNQFNRILLTEHLESLGGKTQYTDNGRSAVEMCSATQYDIVFLDIHMPHMDGQTASRKIRAIEGYENIPIIAVTADVFNEKTHLGEFDSFLYKPIKLRYLQEFLVNYSLIADISAKKIFPYHSEIPAELIERLYQEIPYHSEQLKGQFLRRDFPAMREQIHQLKGLIGYFSVDFLSEILGELSRMVKLQDEEQVSLLLSEFDERTETLIQNYFNEI